MRRYEDGLGGSITILQEGGETAPTRFRMVLPRGFGPPAPECHPHQREEFRVLRGTLDLGRVDGTHVVLREGETFTLSPGSYHLPKNGGDDELEMECVLTPGLDTADMFAALYENTRRFSGAGQFFRVAQVFRRHTRTISFPLPVRAAMAAAAAVSRALGVRSVAG